MNTCTFIIVTGIVLLAFSIQFTGSTECYDCSGCRTQISVNGTPTSDCPEFCKKPGSDPDDEFVKRCSQKFYCVIDTCYCSETVCSGAQLVKMPVFVVFSYMCVTLSLRYLL